MRRVIKISVEKEPKGKDFVGNAGGAGQRVSPADEDKDDREERKEHTHVKSRKFLAIQGYFSAISSTFTRVRV